MNTPSASSQPSKPTSPEKGAAHTFAEWVSLAASALLILALAGYLLFEAFQSNGPIVPVEVQPRLGEVAEINGQFVLPVRVANRGGQTVRDLKIEVRSQPTESADPEVADLLIDFLGEGSEQVAYFYFAEHPNTLKVEARAVSYQAE